MLPAIFFGHGNPMNALTENSFTTAWRRIGLRMPKPKAFLSIPTPYHYLPLLYVLGARQSADVITFPVEGVDGGSISMLGVQTDDARTHSS